MRNIIFSCLIVCGFSVHAQNELEHLTQEQSTKLQLCMNQYNDLHKCYTATIGKHCVEVEDFATGQKSCVEKTERARTEADSENGNENSKSENQRSGPLNPPAQAHITQQPHNVTATPSHNPHKLVLY